MIIINYSVYVPTIYLLPNSMVHFNILYKIRYYDAFSNIFVLIFNKFRRFEIQYLKISIHKDK